MKKFGLLTTLLIGGLLLTGCNKTVENPEIIENDCSIDSSCLVEVDEPTLQENGLSEIENLKQSFQGNIIDGKVDESLLTDKPNSIYFDITGDNTLYYIDEFGLSFSLGEEWKGGKIENAYEGKYLASVWIRNEGLKTYGIFLIDNLTYQGVKDSLSSDGDEYIGNNNAYTFLRRMVENGDNLGEYELNLYNVK